MFANWLFSNGTLDELTRVRKTLATVKTPQWLETNHKDILAYIETNSSITQREYGTISNCSLAARKQDFERLMELNLIEKKGRGHSTYYILVPGD